MKSDADKFKLRSWSVGIEVPFLDLKSRRHDLPELNSGISAQFRDFFNTLRTELTVIRYNNGNHLLLYTLVVRLNMDLVNSDFEVEWDNMCTGITKELEAFVRKFTDEYKIQH